MKQLPNTYNQTIINNIWDILACNYCGNTLEKTDTGAKCLSCNIEYPYTLSGAIDLRLTKYKKYNLEFEVGTPLLPNGFSIEPLTLNDKPDVKFPKNHIHHLTKEVLSYFPKASSNNSLALDLGCGDAIHREVCEYAGFKWVGLDYSSTKAPVLGDAHSLPFKDNTFDFILSIAVLEHIRFPFIMMKEIYRILKPGGKFIGTVSFLEPFHGDSFYHHTHLGTFNSLQYARFTIEKLAPDAKWSVLMAQSYMTLFPKMPRIITKLLVYPLFELHKFWWKFGNLFSPKLSNNIRIRNSTGAFTFITTKNIL
jgi:ubiquinone/menaquinone biosynthesis C-methylase UbiE